MGFSIGVISFRELSEQESIVEISKEHLIKQILEWSKMDNAEAVLMEIKEFAVLFENFDHSDEINNDIIIENQDINKKTEKKFEEKEQINWKKKKKKIYIFIFFFFCKENQFFSITKKDFIEK